MQQKLQAQAQRQLQVRLVQLTRRVLLVQREPQEQQELRALQVQLVQQEVRER